MICRLPSPKVPNVPFLLARGSRREERTREKVMVGLQCTARKKREKWEAGGERKEKDAGGC